MSIRHAACERSTAQNHKRSVPFGREERPAYDRVLAAVSQSKYGCSIIAPQGLSHAPRRQDFTFINSEDAGRTARFNRDPFQAAREVDNLLVDSSANMLYLKQMRVGPLTGSASGSDHATIGAKAKTSTSSATLMA